MEQQQAAANESARLRLISSRSESIDVDPGEHKVVLTSSRPRRRATCCGIQDAMLTVPRTYSSCTGDCCCLESHGLGLALWKIGEGVPEKPEKLPT